MYKFGLTFLFVYSCVITSAAQQQVISDLPRWAVHADFGVVIPEGFITRYMTENNPGFNGELLYRVQDNKPFLVGINLFWTPLQSETDFYSDFIDGEVFNIRERTSSYFLNTGVNVRFQPEFNWMIQPYLQGQFGWYFYHTGTTFRDQDVEEVYDRISEESSSTLGYSVTGGIHIVPNYWYARFDLRFTYMRNPAVEMLTKTGETSGTPIEAFELNVTPASFVYISFGGTYLF